MKKIFWIEDEYDIIKYVVSPLKRNGYKFDIASTYNEFEYYKGKIADYDLIIIDLILPEENSSPPSDKIGFQILDKLSEDINGDIPIIVFTVINNHITNSRLDKYEFVNKVLYKPIPSNQLMREVEALTSTSQRPLHG